MDAIALLFFGIDCGNVSVKYFPVWIQVVRVHFNLKSFEVQNNSSCTKKSGLAALCRQTPANWFMIQSKKLHITGVHFNNCIIYSPCHHALPSRLVLSARLNNKCESACTRREDWRDFPGDGQSLRFLWWSRATVVSTAVGQSSARGIVIFIGDIID